MINDTHNPEDDDALWEAEVRAAKKLGRKERVAGKGVKDKNAVTPQSEAIAGLGSAKCLTPQRVRGDTGAPPPSYSELSLGDASGVDRNTAEKFRKGKMPVEAQLDLHGYTQDEALHALRQFIPAAWGEGRRVVLIVTGKGARSEENILTGKKRGVLQEAVPRWLNLPDLRPHLVMFCHAAPEDGGFGALYVLLRRKRENR